MVSEIIQTIVTALTEFLSGIGQGIVTFMRTVFVETTGGETTLSLFGIVALTFFAVGLGFWVVRKVLSLIKANK